MFFKLRCHSCGARSNYPKGTYHFDCIACDAPNYYDIKGDVLDPPTPVAAAPPTFQRGQASFSRDPPHEAPQQDSSVFCSRCRKNQQIYTEALSNYLPDEDHPQYADFEAGLPAAKAKLEKEYPLVCTNCASKAQNTIHQADYYGKSQQFSRMAMETRRSRGGGRDDWGKFWTRRLLDVVGMTVYASLLAQLAWHAYGIFVELTRADFLSDIEAGDFDFDFDPTIKACTWLTTGLRFEASCFRLFSTLMPKALLTSLCLIWYNPGLKQWYHRTWRMEEIIGQTEHFRIQAFLLLMRASAWLKLSNDQAFSKHQLLAFHGFMIVFCIVCQWLSNQVITARRWTLKGKITPKPDVVDVFGATAGPAEESYDRQPSSVPPHLRLLTRNAKPFPIENLAPTRGYSRLDLPSMPPPSPPDTQSSPSIDGDAMDIDSVSYTNRREDSHAHFGGIIGSQPQPGGWGGMRTSLFDIDDSARARQVQTTERARQVYSSSNIVKEQSPFRGSLPPAPMSMGKRLRNPPLHVVEAKIPLSQRSNFMELMRPGKPESSFAVPDSTPKKSGIPAYADPFANDDDFSPIKQRVTGRQSDGFTPKSRTNQSLNLRPAQFTLQSDLSNATGLEDLFGGGSFSITDPDAVRPADLPSTASNGGFVLAKSLTGLAVIGIAVGMYSIPEFGSAANLWLEGLREGLHL